jgi:hypothetical protein
MSIDSSIQTMAMTGTTSVCIPGSLRTMGSILPRGANLLLAALLAVIANLATPVETRAQATAPPSGWDAGISKQPPATALDAPQIPQSGSGGGQGQTKSNTTVIERAGDAKTGANGQVRLVALLTSDGQQIDQGLVWRVYQNSTDPAAKAKLVTEYREPTPLLKLPPGDYVINAAFGRAHITRKVSLKANAQPAIEQFVLNAGGLRLNALVAGKAAPSGMVSYAIFSDDRDQFANRTAVMTGAKPNLIMRLNAGIYRLVSTYGDANARVETDVTVEAGKLTEASVAHTAGKATFRLVASAGSEALPDTQWTIASSSGEIVKESVGALPTHILAPGAYTVTARSSGQTLKKEFAVKDGETVTVEVLKDGSESIDAETLRPSLEIKNQ